MRLALLALSLLVPQEKAEIKYQPKVGDKITESQKTHMKLKIVVKQDMEEQTMDFEQRGSEKKTILVQDVQDGRIKKATFEIVEDYEEGKEPGSDEFKRKESPLHGKKVVVTENKEGKLEYEGVAADAKAKKSLKLNNPFSRALPKKALAAGDSWEIQGKELQELIDDEKADGKMTLTFKGFKEVGKRRCAVLEATMEVKGKTDEGMDMAMKMSGEVLVGLDRGYVVGVKMSGTVSMKNPEMNMTGEGPMTLEITADY